MWWTRPSVPGLQAPALGKSLRGEGAEQPTAPEHNSVVMRLDLPIKTVHTYAPAQLRLRLWFGKREVEALVYSGAMGNFINPRLVEELGATLAPLAQPRPVLAADGAQMAVCTHSVSIPAKLPTGRTTELHLFVVPVSEEIIIGLPWLQEKKTIMDFGREEIRFAGKEENPGHNYYPWHSKQLPLISVRQIEALTEQGELALMGVVSVWPSSENTNT